MNVLINGRFLTRKTTGVDRYAREIIKQLDELTYYSAIEMYLVYPAGVQIEQPLHLNRIRPLPWGSHSGTFWEQFEFPKALKQYNGIGLNLCGSGPLVNPGIICIHDVSTRVNPHFFSRPFSLWHNIRLLFLTRRARSVITVSRFSKRELETYYPVTKGKIYVAPPAWQHMNEVQSDNDIFSKYPVLDERPFYYALSSLAPNKNLPWLIEAAKRNSDCTIAIAGGVDQRIFGQEQPDGVDNTLFLGYVSDGESKALMERCSGFLFPTFYEGFGIPPLEALSCGAQIAVSDSDVMHEVYGDSARYIDPNIPCDTLIDLFSNKVDRAVIENTLSSYSWTKSARIIASVLEKARHE